MSSDVKMEAYLETVLIRERLPEPLLDLLGDLHWGEEEKKRLLTSRDGGHEAR